ncbi:MAG: Rrf2 family transcriptional regulator [Planctomycetota bacterium]|nr:MAG: Rrf2 family transcriptional regulator [Planctomycetota bacterium]RKY14331.1 MAG: Rrf2 family transcriptional regulator [Planctomycetota bacterium]
MSYPYFQISKKSGYAIRGLLELALRGDEGPVNVRTLAKAQDIPIRFLEIILNELKQGGFVLSVRGKAGGYQLARVAEDITVGQIVQFLDRNMRTSDAAADGLPHHGDFVLSSMMKKINRAVSDVCDETSLKDMVAEVMKNQSAFVSSYII